MRIATNSKTPLFIFTLLLLLGFTAPGFAQSFTVTPSAGSTLNFETHAGVLGTQTFTVKNNSAVSLPVAVGITGSPDFTVAGVPAANIAAGASQQFTVNYMASAAGNNTGTLTIKDLLGDSAVYQLNGHTIANGVNRIVSPAVVEFNTIAGQTQCLPVALGNQSVGAVAITNAHITGDSSEFTTSSNGSLQISSGGTGNLQVCFNPKQAINNAEGLLTYTYTSLIDTAFHGTGTVALEGKARAAQNTGDSLYFNVTNNLDFNNVQVGQTACQAVAISNPTAQSVTLDSAYVMGSGASAYQVSGSLSSSNTLTIGAHSTQYVNVCFTPTVSGENQNGTLVLNYTVPGTTMKGNLYTSLEGSSFNVDSLGNGGESTNCLIVRHGTGNIGGILAGGTSSSTVYLTNRTNSAVTISGASLSGSNSSAFNLTGNTFPMTLAAGQQGALTINFAPSADPTLKAPSALHSQVTLNVTGGNNCGPVTINVNGVELPGTGDTTKLNLGGNGGITNNGNGGGVIGITNNSNKSCTIDTLTFTNTTAVNVNVESVQVGSSANFTLLGTSASVPGIVAPGATLQAYVQFCSNGQSNTLFNGQLYVLTDQSIQPQTYQLQGIQSAPLGVATVAPASVGFAIMPNPTTGRVTVQITDARSTTVEVYDVIGNMIYSTNGSSSIVWNGLDQTGAPIANGEYIVRVSGIDQQGNAFRSSKQVVVQR